MQDKWYVLLSLHTCVRKQMATQCDIEQLPTYIQNSTRHGTLCLITILVTTIVINEHGNSLDSYTRQPMVDLLWWCTNTSQQ